MTTAPEILRDAGMRQTENAADPRIILAIDAVIARYNASGQPWSVNDVRDEFPVSHGELIGARVRAAAMRKPQEMTKVGAEPSTLRSTHSKEVAVWRGVS